MLAECKVRAARDARISPLERSGRHDMTKTLLLSAGLALTMAAGASPAAANSAPVEVVGQRLDEGQLTHRVVYGDLDLAAQTGQKTLTRRVRQAVNIVCSPLDSRGLHFEHRECRNFAWDGAQPQMALAIERAQQLAANGRTAIPEVAISVVAPSVR